MNHIIVTESSSNIRRIAWTALKDNWIIVVIGMALYHVMTYSIPVILGFLMPAATYNYFVEQLDGYISVSYVSNLYNFLLTGAFVTGLSSYALVFLRNRDSNPGHIFDGFEVFFKAFLLTIVQGVFIFLWTLLFIIPGIIAAFRYSQSYMFLADDPKRGVMECINLSKQTMAGNKGKYFCLLLSFIGWALLASLSTTFLPMPSGIVGVVADFVYSIPTFFFYAYINVARAAFFDLATGRLVAADPGRVDSDYHF